mmetsp:Transcript_52897/g.84047  ORF Transcript_52897/g.84047 Transcript_52897/m.84047 type:complete len:768 (-) Transcript_52897:105-2408(-)
MGVLCADRTRSILSTAAEFATIADQVKNDDLRAWTEKVALEGLLICERHCESCVKFLLSSMSSSDASVAHDALWMLRKMAIRSQLVRAWIQEAHGGPLIQSALVAYASSTKVLDNGVWLIYTVAGVEGFAGLLYASNGTSEGHAAIRTKVAWSIYEIVTDERREACCVQPRPEFQALLPLLVETMDHDSASPDAQWACVAALDAMVKGEPMSGNLFIQAGGARLIVTALKSFVALGDAGEDYRRAVGYLMASLVDGNNRAADALRAEGALQILAEEGLCGNGRDTEASLWALGSLGGLAAVLPAMTKHGLHRPDIVHGGISAICECVSKSSGSTEKLQCLPVALNMMLELLSRNDNPEHIRAIGCVASSLAPHYAPRAHPDLDRGVEVLYHCVRESLKNIHAAASSSEAISRSSNGEESVDMQTWRYMAEVSVEALGNVAIAAPAQWGDTLRRCGALETLQQGIRTEPHLELLKHLFWAAASLAGLHFVVSELQSHLHGIDVVAAALCTISRIFDAEAAGSHVLPQDVALCSEAEMPSVLGIVLEALRMHQGEYEIQQQGCLCIAALAPNIPQLADLPLASQIVVVVLAAARRFPRHFDVLHGTCASLRELCTLLRPRAHNGMGSSEALVGTLRSEGASQCVEQILDDFEGASEREGANSELAEDAIVVLCILLGVEKAMSRLSAASPGSLLRCAGLKGVYEACRLDMSLVAGATASSVAEAVHHMVAEEPADVAGRLRQAGNLLVGICGSPAIGISSTAPTMALLE